MAMNVLISWSSLVVHVETLKQFFSSLFLLYIVHYHKNQSEHFKQHTTYTANPGKALPVNAHITGYKVILRYLQLQT